MSMMSCPRVIVAMAAMWLVAGAVASPVRRSPDLEARRRSAIDRSMIRFGRSYPPEPSAADIRDAIQHPVRRGNAFLRFGRSQPLTLTSEDLMSLLKAYEEEYEAPTKKQASFIRYGRDPSFVRFGRSDEEKNEIPEVVLNVPQRKSRARDHFIRLGRDSEEMNEDEDRSKRSAECQDCA